MTERLYRNPKFVDLTGQRFGRLAVVKETTAPSGRLAWLCRCDCGAEKTVLSSNLRSGATTSCGCFHKEVVAKTTTVHGRRKHPMYSVWRAMLRRCAVPEDPSFSRYGGRGITVSEAWHDMDQFFADMEPSWQKGLELDRIDNDGPYSKENCRWTTRAANAQNKGDTVLNWPLVESVRGRYWNGETPKQIASSLGLRYGVVHRCISNRTWKPQWAKPEFTITPNG